jgi:beta-glucosidase-like glycosyl hydrolase
LLNDDDCRLLKLTLERKYENPRDQNHRMHCRLQWNTSVCSALQAAAAQESASLPFLNPQLSPEQRATDLVHRMTLAEKATQMQNNSAAVPRLNVPAYQWWSEALHGVINQGVTEYPEPVGLAWRATRSFSSI